MSGARKFRKIPVVVLAFEYTGENWPDVVEWIESQPEHPGMSTTEAIIPTLEGPHIVTPGDFVIRGVKGEFYACKPDIFRQTYEEVD